MNSRGQAFSTFQLLISAIIALAILVLLLNIIGGLDIFGGQKPNETASNLVTSQVNSPGELATSIKVKFSRDDSLNAKSIAAQSGVLTAGQICLSLGDFLDSSGEEFVNENNIIRYTGSASLNVKISALCDTGGELPDDLDAYSSDYANWSSDCDNIPQNQTACIVALRFA